jgi:hypothetical protein
MSEILLFQSTVRQFWIYSGVKKLSHKGNTNDGSIMRNSQYTHFSGIQVSISLVYLHFIVVRALSFMKQK